MKLRYIVTAVDERRAGVEYLKKHIPDLEVEWDIAKRPPHSHMETFLNARRRVAVDEGAIYFEDDVCLTKNFMSKALSVIHERPLDLVQFFCRSAKDQTIGARYDTYFLCNCCVYYPPGFSQRVVDYFNSDKWESEKASQPSGSDTMVHKMLASDPVKLWVHVPSLVQHASEDSIIGIKGYGRDRSHYRHSTTFTEPELEGYPYKYPRRQLFG